MAWVSEFGCRTCGSKAATSRGCCDRCYHLWLGLVQAGKTTWALLKRQGKARAPRPDR
ncbi:MAG TPA: hypothetical protein VG013_06125 [Gemmataceae bacterium]|nr:hypothetical protein [Gemmataceae bacterium]